MKGGKIPLLVAVLIGGGFVEAEAGCRPQEQPPTNQELNLKGWLGYTPNGFDPHIRNLSTGEDRPLYDVDSTDPQFVQIGRPGNEFTLIGRKGAIVAGSWGRDSGLYLIRNDKSTVLAKGDTGRVYFTKPVFFAAHEKLLYVRREKGVSGDWSEYLYEVAFEDDRLQEELPVGDPDGLKGQMGEFPNFLVKISDDELLFQHHDGGYVVYDLRTRRLIRVPIRRSACVPKAWRSKTRELVCGGMGTWDLFDLKGNKRRIPGEVPPHVGAYVPGDSSDYLFGFLLYATRGGCGAIQDLIYDFKSGKSWPSPIKVHRGHWYEVW